LTLIHPAGAKSSAASFEDDDHGCGVVPVIALAQGAVDVDQVDQAVAAGRYPGHVHVLALEPGNIVIAETGGEALPEDEPLGLSTPALL
jgi:hypothetical protein